MLYHSLTSRALNLDAASASPFMLTPDDLAHVDVPFIFQFFHITRHGSDFITGTQ